MYLDKEAILSSLTIEDVTRVVMSLGSATPKTDSNGDLIFQSICHNIPDPGNSYKLYYYHEAKEPYKPRTFHCYSKCSESFSIIELVIRAHRMQGKTLSWYKALYYIGQITGKVIGTANNTELASKNDIIDDFVWINRFKSIQKTKRTIPTLSEINENILEIFNYTPHEEFLKDHISCEAMSRFEISYFGLTNQIVLPHRDSDGRLIGIRGRYLDEEDIEAVGKYVPLQISGKFLAHRLGSNLYGLHVAKNAISKIKKIVLVESEKGCLQSYSYYGEDSFTVAVCGSNITTTQIRMILELGVEEVMIAFDRMYEKADGYEATIYYNKLVTKVAPLVPFVKVYLILDKENRLPYKQSPFDEGKEVLEQLMKEKTQITMEEVNRVKEEKLTEIRK